MAIETCNNTLPQTCTLPVSSLWVVSPCAGGDITAAIGRTRLGRPEQVGILDIIDGQRRPSNAARSNMGIILNILHLSPLPRLPRLELRHQIGQITRRPRSRSLAFFTNLGLARSIPDIGTRRIGPPRISPSQPGPCPDIPPLLQKRVSSQAGRLGDQWSGCSAEVGSVVGGHVVVVVLVQGGELPLVESALVVGHVLEGEVAEVGVEAGHGVRLEEVGCGRNATVVGLDGLLLLLGRELEYEMGF